MNADHNPARMSQMFPASALSFLYLGLLSNLSCIQSALRRSCTASVLFFISPVLHPSCPVSDLSCICIWPVLHPLLCCICQHLICLASVLSCSCPVFYPSRPQSYLSCPSSDLSCIHLVLYSSCPAFVVYCIILKRLK